MAQRTQMRERDERTLHEKRVDAGRAGGLAPHQCRGRGCSGGDTASRSDAGEGAKRGGRRSRRKED